MADNILTQPGDPEPLVRGRPLIPVDEELLKQFLSVRMPVRKICRYWNISEPSLYRRYGQLIHHYYAQFDFDILYKQKELADAGDGKMLIHLGKVTQGQVERAPITDDFDDGDGGVEFVVRRPKLATSEMSTDEREELE